MKIIVNHIGYIPDGKKKVIVQLDKADDRLDEFCVNSAAGERIYTGKLSYSGKVANWHTGYYLYGDFSDLHKEGRYYITAGSLRSPEFVISEGIPRIMLNAVGCYFKTQRDSGEWALEDTHLKFKGDRQGCVDVHGGWYDASGDLGIHLSHLSHSSYYNPQQMSFSGYAFFKAYDFMGRSHDEQTTLLRRRYLDEGYWGADFLMRMRAPSGSFLKSINRIDSLATVSGSRAIGFEYRQSSSQFSEKAATADIETVTDENYETGLRSGGGLAIATLAAAARHFYPASEYTQKEYIEAAMAAWGYLKRNNERYLNDGKWNLVDEYCALIASTELYITTGEYEYLRDARDFSGRIAARAKKVGDGLRRLEVADGLPFYHASDEGMPIVALIQYAEAEPSAEKKAEAICIAEEIMRWKLSVSHETANPFDYPMVECGTSAEPIRQFFFPHDTTAAPWWQGDNARIASIAAAACELAHYTADEKLREECIAMSYHPLDWIMGLNPFDACCIEGYGRNNIRYYWRYRYDYLNAPGGICNGITSGMDDEEDIEFVTEPNDVIDDNWRWAEQWIPHASWYIYALAALTV